jgi:hypothetical protein
MEIYVQNMISAAETQAEEAYLMSLLQGVASSLQGYQSEVSPLKCLPLGAYVGAPGLQGLAQYKASHALACLYVQSA